jgi:hypothetical protein
MLKKYAYINETNHRYMNVIFTDPVPDKLRTDIFIREVTLEDFIKYDLFNQDTITCGYDDNRQP